MPLAPLKKQHITIIWPIKTFEQSWTRPKVESWIKNAKGTVSTELSESTTHLIISADEWRGQGEMVKEALARNANARKGKEIKIVHGDWLQEVLLTQKKPREGPHRWDKREKWVIEGERDKGSNMSALGSSEGRMANTSKPSLMADLLSESTEAFLDPREMKKIERQNKEEERLKREADEERESEARKRREEVRKIVGLGQRKAKNEIFSENWHLFVDDTCFPYDITLTKVDVSSNRNDVVEITLKIQIWESNTEPHVYAVNLYHGGTDKAPANHLLAAIGANFMTAMRVFKDAFSEQTGGADWDRRISHAVNRRRAERLAKNQGLKRASTSKKRFAEIPFRYDPPRYGPRGRLTEEEKENFKEIGPQNRGYGPGGRPETRDDIELWMSGGIPTAPDAEELLTRRPEVVDQDEEGIEVQELPSMPIVAARQPTAFEVLELAQAEEAEEQRKAQAQDDLDAALDGDFDKNSAVSGDLDLQDFAASGAVLSASNGGEGSDYVPKSEDMGLPNATEPDEFLSFLELKDLTPEEIDSLIDQTYPDHSALGQVGNHSQQNGNSPGDGTEQQLGQSGEHGNDAPEIHEMQDLSAPASDNQTSSPGSFPVTQVPKDAVEGMQGFTADLPSAEMPDDGTDGGILDISDEEAMPRVEAQGHNDGGLGSNPTTLDLGSSLLGKRKAAELDEAGEETNSNKRLSIDSMP